MIQNNKKNRNFIAPYVTMLKTPRCTMSESEITSASNWKVIRDSEAGKARAGKNFHFDRFSGLKGFNNCYIIVRTL